MPQPPFTENPSEAADLSIPIENSNLETSETSEPSDTETNTAEELETLEHNPITQPEITRTKWLPQNVYENELLEREKRDN